MMLPRPALVVSKCLGFAACRYNGATIPDAFVQRLRDHVDIHPVCPEVEIGLGIPRAPVRIVMRDRVPRLVQPASGADVTDRMRTFAEQFLSSLGPVDGFILKGRSPSCGLRDAKLYAGTEKGPAISRSSGLFGGAVLTQFGGLAVEDEGRLLNPRIREHFLTKLYALARWRVARDDGSASALVRLHAQNKLLLMAYHQAEMRVMGRLVANHEKRPLAEVWQGHGQRFSLALARPPRCGANINVLMHALGYFSSRLTPAEKAFFLEALEKYRANRMSLSAIRLIVGAWLARYEDDYLREQTFLAPFPEELADPAMGLDACTARDYWSDETPERPSGSEDQAGDVSGAQ